MLNCFFAGQGAQSPGMGKDLAENDPGFLRWIIKNDFPDDVKEIASNALIGKYPTRNAGAGE